MEISNRSTYCPKNHIIDGPSCRKKTRQFQHTILSIFWYFCPKLSNIFFSLFQLFLHFSITFRIWVTSFIAWYFTHLLSQGVQEHRPFFSKLATLDIFHWPMLENRSKISLGHIWAPKFNLLWIRWVQPTCQLRKIKCTLVHSKCRAKNVQEILLLEGKIKRYLWNLQKMLNLSCEC